ncbi:hypothetical protein GSN00_09890 [Cylindrospermopsis raciborskii CHAB3438]|uniref:hypothetical protein n=1 Tax=Cylindrospermopsis raciborskii TaxID=77022 RepID=UPI001F117D83|nr:hypothetical protein [Cylindrospermopsis raciborskii]MCH4904684.1 hypothetical protein [Cylindrospermopsis raciborskii CHAB3438]
MQVIEKNSLFAQVSGEQSAVVSGGNAREAALLLGALLASGSTFPLGVVDATLLTIINLSA